MKTLHFEMSRGISFFFPVVAKLNIWYCKMEHIFL